MCGKDGIILINYPFNFEQTKTLREALFVFREHLSKTETDHYKRNYLYYQNIANAIQHIWMIQYKDKYGLNVCPKCSNEIQYIDQIMGFMCGNCMVLIFGDKQVIPIPETEVFED